MSSFEQEIITHNEAKEVALRSQRVEEAGRVLSEISIKWWDAEDTQALITTEGSKLLIESRTEQQHAVTTVLTESVARIGDDGPIYPGVIFRREGNPDEDIKVGKWVTILGLSQNGREFDIDSMFTTGTVTEIKLLQ
tara:strand:- start:13573 stop:13983 length:411 start_codon:yes stop_codon:yes gene_type:complete